MINLTNDELKDFILKPPQTSMPGDFVQRMASELLQLRLYVETLKAHRFHPLSECCIDCGIRADEALDGDVKCPVRESM